MLLRKFKPSENVTIAYFYFSYSIILRILGTVLGGVAGIIIWEITRGNPYGLVILTFFVMWPLYYVFFTNQVLNIVAIMTQVTLMLVSDRRKKLGTYELNL